MIGTLIVTSGKVDYKYKVGENNCEDSSILNNNSQSNVYIFPREQIYNKTLDYFLEGKFTENTIITNISSDIIIKETEIDSDGYVVVNGYIKRYVNYEEDNSISKRLRSTVKFTQRLEKSIGKLPKVSVGNNIGSSYYFQNDSQLIIIMSITFNLQYEV
jgi:hypothetical protein